MPTSRNTDPPEEVVRQKLALAVETLSNLHYLIEHSYDDPDSVKKFVEMAGPAMDVLREFAWQRETKTSGPSMIGGSEDARPNEPADDHSHPQPLAAADEDNPTSGPEAPPETRVDRLEAD